ncbi:MCM2/3/5 family-domain-containing protein [Hyaloraphidium curvatum]|nr:MCM2/3/5 family-domain-containing protein [Hyaloraphidium curvatum]
MLGGAVDDGPDALRNLNFDEAYAERVREFSDFLDDGVTGEGTYRDKIKKLLSAGENRLIVSVDDLREQKRALYDGLLRFPADYLPAFDEALKSVALANANLSKKKLEDTKFAIGLEGSFGEHHLSPRELSARFIGKMVCLEGIVTRCSLVRPKVAKSVHYCEATQMFETREYRDALTIGHGMPTSTTYPKEDENGNPLTTEYGFCTYRDNQRISLQEMPERAPAGQLPRPVDVVLDDDLVDKVKPGDRVAIVGVYRSIGNNQGGQSATFKTLILANAVKLLNKEVSSFQLTEDDVAKIRQVNKTHKKNVLELLANSVAPSIWGHDWLKKAVVLFLLGGVEKNLENGTHIRGDINMLMVGDPSTAKSQMLRCVMNIAPLAIATTGRGSSGVGLTAAVVTDRDTGERRLEAGAMVLADRGVVCIDEFDKMTDADRVAIHEVMEQQTVTIAKAGIHTSLNARCSVIAAANPAYGQYEADKEPHKNIALPDSLLSRFDLLFIVQDEIDPVRDSKVAEHVLRMHRFQPPRLDPGVPITENNIQNLYDDADDTANGEHEVYEKYNRLLHGNLKQTSKDKKKVLLTLLFLKKYLHYAKNRIKPTLTSGAVGVINECYVNLRTEEKRDDSSSGSQKMKTLPVTVRSLETLIRLSTAHAKARLSPVVEKEDAEKAQEIVKFMLFHEVQKSSRKRRKTEHNENNDSSSEEGSDDDDEAPKPSTTPRRRNARASTAEDDSVERMENMSLDANGDPAPSSSRRRGRKQAVPVQSPEDEETQDSGAAMDAAEDDSGMELEQPGKATQDPEHMTYGGLGIMAPDDLDDARFEAFRSRLGALRARAVGDVLPFTTLMAHINDDLEPGSERFDIGEVVRGLYQMDTASGSIMVESQNIVFI